MFSSAVTLACRWIKGNVAEEENLVGVFGGNNYNGSKQRDEATNPLLS
jgi:hypothetical protein